MTTLIVGATGLVGGEICRLLTSQGYPVRTPDCNRGHVVQLPAAVDVSQQL